MGSWKGKGRHTSDGAILDVGDGVYNHGACNHEGPQRLEDLKDWG